MRRCLDPELLRLGRCGLGLRLLRRLGSLGYRLRHNRCGGRTFRGQRLHRNIRLRGALGIIAHFHAQLLQLGLGLIQRLVDGQSQVIEVQSGSAQTLIHPCQAVAHQHYAGGNAPGILGHAGLLGVGLLLQLLFGALGIQLGIGQNFLGFQLGFPHYIGRGGRGCVQLAGCSQLLCLAGHDSLALTGGEWQLLGCAFLFSTQILLVDHFSPKLDGIQLSFVQFLTVAVISTVFMLIFEQPTIEQFRLAAVSIAYCGIMSSGVAYTLQIVGQKALDPTIASLAMCLESVFSALAGWLILGETLSTTELCGCALMFAAIVASQLPDKKKV